MRYRSDVVTVLVTALLICTAESKRNRHKRQQQRKVLKVKDCGGDPNRPIQVIELAVRPMPVTIPGKIRVWTTLNITEDLPLHMGVNMQLVKHRDGIVIPTPCQQPNFCHYKDICSIMKSYFEVHRCPKKLRRTNNLCKCQYKKGIYQVAKLKFYLPDVDPPLSVHVEGQYDLKLQIIDETDKREMGCIQLSFYVKHKTRKRRWYHREMS